MHPSILQVSIPAGVDFADLQLARDADGDVSFDWSAIESLCVASNIPVELLRDGPEDRVAGLIVAWYQAHRQHGGAVDPVAEDLLAETLAETSAGQAVSHKPGRA